MNYLNGAGVIPVNQGGIFSGHDGEEHIALSAALMMAGPPAGSAAVADANAVYLAFKANNPLADVVLAYARTSYGELDRQFSRLDIPRGRMLQAATFADYHTGVRVPLDNFTAEASDLLSFSGAVKRWPLR